MSNDFMERQRAKIADKVKEVNTRVEQARKRVPADFHDFLVLIEQNVKIGNFFADQTLRDEFPALWTKQGEGQGKGQTYLTVALPYMAVDGRVKMFVEEHKQAGKRFEILTYIDGIKALAAMLKDAPTADPAELKKAIPERAFSIMTALVTSELYGAAIGSAKINWDGSGVDSTNPYENAQTSAVGRALGFLGFGLVGTGIASAEEVRDARAEQSAKERDRRAAPAEPVAGPTTVKPDSPKPTPPSAPADAKPSAKPAESPAAPAKPSPDVPAAPKQEPAGDAKPNAGDEALNISDGPCVDCGLEVKTLNKNAILSRRKNGEAVRWSHNSFKGYSCEKAKGANGTQ